MKFGRNVGVLTLGTGISQGVMLLGVIVLSRLYTPAEFGVYALVLGIATVASVASSFRYEMTVLLPKSTHLSELALRLAFSVSVFVNMASLFCVACFVALGILAPNWLIVPFTAFFASVINIASFLQNRKKQYIRIAAVQIARAVLFIALAILASLLGYAGNGLTLAMVLSMGVVAFFLLVFDFRNANSFKELSRMGRLSAWGRKNKKFVRYSTPAVFVNSLAVQAPIFLLSMLAGSGVAGYYMMIQRVMMAPVTLVSGAVNKVYMQSVATRRANGEAIYQFTQSIVRRFLVPGLVLACAMFVVFNLGLLEKVFGANWEGIDVLSLVMIPAFCISFIAKSISGFSILGRNELGLVYQVVLLLLVSVAIFISTLLTDSNLIIFSAISAALSLCFLGQSASILRLSKKLDGAIPR